jgi:hypothetical protein
VALFRLGHDEYQHELPWLLMRNGPVTKYWRRDEFEEDIAEMASRGFRVAHFDADSWADEDEMYRELRERLGLPASMGMNFDALASGESLRNSKLYGSLMTSRTRSDSGAGSAWPNVVRALP